MTNQYEGTGTKGLFEIITIAGAMIVFCLGVCAGITMGEQETINKWKQETVKRGYAEYNATTGEWQWKGDKPEATE